MNNRQLGIPEHSDCTMHLNSNSRTYGPIVPRKIIDRFQQQKNHTVKNNLLLLYHLKKWCGNSTRSIGVVVTATAYHLILNKLSSVNNVDCFVHLPTSRPLPAPCLTCDILTHRRPGQYM